MATPTTVLDNLAWHALSGPQAELAERSENGRALRYQPKVSPICAVDQLDYEAWEGLAQVASSKGYVSLFRDQIFGSAGDELPGGRSHVFLERASQYVATSLDEPPDLPFVALGHEDADEMLALAKLTEPGPFAKKTYLTGAYVGLRRDGQLIAMAGRRMHANGWGEISAVCVHPSALREGLGAAVTLAAAAEISRSGDRPMLHVRPKNTAAHQLYLKLGFEVRRTIEVGIFRWTGGNG